MNNLIKRCGYFVLGNNLRIKRRIHKIGKLNKLTVLTLHKVGDDDISSYQPLSSRLFEELIIFLEKNYYITSFSELSNINKIITSKPLVILSYDDGYKDFMNITIPILKKYNIRVNQNVIPECVSLGRPPLNVSLQDYIGKTELENLFALKIPGFEWPTNLKDKVKLGFLLSNYIKSNPHYVQQKIRKKVEDQIGDRLYSLSSRMMDIEDIKSIINLHDIGIHSYSHSNMALETEEYVRNDMKKCREWFFSKFDRYPSIYAFPNSSYKKQDIQTALDLGYTNVLLVDNKFSSINTSIHYRFNFDVKSKSAMKFWVAGGFRRIL